MKKTIIAIMIFFSCAILNAQERRALLIGIGDYPAEHGWNKIHGQNDIELIHQTLNKQGFPDENISVLIDAEATYSNIMIAFQSLLDISNKNDIIYLQFSGHGQRITDVDGDETDRFDEAWIPYDAPKRYSKGAYEGERHITDDFLNEYLTKLRFKVGYSGKIIVIADACHSGSGSRGLGDDEEVFKRGSYETFVVPKEPSNVIRKEKDHGDWLFVAACKDYETNYEYKAANGEYYGRLTYSIAKTAEQLNEINYKDAIDAWKTIMHEIIGKEYKQHIDNEGRPSKKNSKLF